MGTPEVASLGPPTFKVGPGRIRVAGGRLEMLRPETEVGDGFARFVQTVSSHAGFPAPRHRAAARHSCASVLRPRGRRSR